MYKEEVKVINELGLHARPASAFVKIATPFKSDIKITCKDKSGVAKSILSVMALNAGKDDVMTIEAEGEDEKEAVQALVKFIAEGCGE